MAHGHSHSSHESSTLLILSILAILALVLYNTYLLVKQTQKESFITMDTDRTTTYTGPYEGPTFCSGIGIRNTNKGSHITGYDPQMFGTGPRVSSIPPSSDA